MVGHLELAALATLFCVHACFGGGHGGEHKRVIIHVPYKVKTIHHTHTIVKHVGGKGHDGGGDQEYYKVIGYSGGIDSGKVLHPEAGGASYESHSSGWSGGSLGGGESSLGHDHGSSLQGAYSGHSSALLGGHEGGLGGGSGGDLGGHEGGLGGHGGGLGGHEGDLGGHEGGLGGGYQGGHEASLGGYQGGHEGGLGGYQGGLGGGHEGLGGQEGGIGGGHEGYGGGDGGHYGDLSEGYSSEHGPQTFDGGYGGQGYEGGYSSGNVIETKELNDVAGDESKPLNAIESSGLQQEYYGYHQGGSSPPSSYNVIEHRSSRIPKSYYSGYHPDTIEEPTLSRSRFVKAPYRSYRSSEDGQSRWSSRYQ